MTLITISRKCWDEGDFRMTDQEHQQFSVAIVCTKHFEEADIQQLSTILEENGLIVEYVVTIPRDLEKIKEKLFDLFIAKYGLVITLGAVGMEEDDIVPEATGCVIDKRLEGLETAIRYSLIEKGVYSILNRGIAGIYHKSIVINLPGNISLISQILTTILPWVRDGLTRI